MSIFEEYDGDIRENLRSRAEVIIESIAESYENGSIDDPKANHTMMSLFALACENKIEGEMAEPGVKWTLTAAYSKKLEEELMNWSAIDGSSKVVKGPW